MNLEQLEQQYGPIPDTLDREKMETLLKKRVNTNTLLTVPLVDSVEEWLDDSLKTPHGIDWERVDVPYDMLDGTTNNLTGLEIVNGDKKLIIVLVDDYSTFNKKVVHRGIAGKIHFRLIEDGYRVVWCKKFEWETPRKRTVMQSIIMHYLGKTTSRYYARNTVCEVIEPRLTKQFSETGSFYGHRNASQAVCLKDKKTGEILNVLTFGKCYYGRDKYGDDNVVECIRSVGKPFTVVTGGMSKLMKFYLEGIGKEVKTIIFYVDSSHYHSESMDTVRFKKSHFAPNGVHNLWIDTGSSFMRTPALNKEIKYLQKLGLILAIPDTGTETFVYYNEELAQK